MLQEIKEKIKTILTSRKTSYQFTFQENNVYAQAVLSDLARFCKATETTFHTDSRVHAVLEGRREVFLRIQNHLNLSPEELSELIRKE